nr:hypothetical protein BaRGS_022032 [Batillaria attramentaria]
MFVLSGDCHLVLNNSEYFGRFLAAFHDLLTKQLHIKDDTYKLGEVTCGSVRVYVTFMNVIMPEFDVMIQTAIHNGGRALSVPVWIDSGQFMTFEVTHAEQVELKPDVDTYNIVSTVMDEVDIIVIVVACCVCGVLIAIGIAICVKECYRRKYAQSFDLLEIPHVNLKLEDFTLTRIPRPKTIYTEGSSVTMKSFTDGGGGGGGRSHQQNGGSLSHSSNGHTRTPSINAEDMHVRVKSHSEGIVIGITSSQPHSAAGATGDPFSNGTLKKNKSRMRTPSGDDYPEGEYQASERLLGGRPHDVDGTLNPVFVDEVEGEEGEGGLDEGAVL